MILGSIWESATLLCMDYTKSENEYATPGILEKEKHTVVEIIMRKERNELERNVESQNILLDAISSLYYYYVGVANLIGLRSVVKFLRFCVNETPQTSGTFRRVLAQYKVVVFYNFTILV